MAFFCVNGARGENTKKSRRADRRREAKTRMPEEHARGGKKSVIEELIAEGHDLRGVLFLSLR